MSAPQRRFIKVVVALAALLAMLQGTAGLTDLAFFGGPVLLITGLLSSGRFFGEDHVVRRLRRGVVAVRPRRVRVRWPRVPARTLSSLLVHDPRVERGPPVCVFAV